MNKKIYIYWINKFTNVHKQMFYSKSWWAISVYYAVKRFLNTLSGWVLFFEVFFFIWSLCDYLFVFTATDNWVGGINYLYLSHGYTICEIIKHVYANLIENLFSSSKQGIRWLGPRLDKLHKPLPKYNMVVSWYNHAFGCIAMLLWYIAWDQMITIFIYLVLPT